MWRNVIYYSVNKRKLGYLLSNCLGNLVVNLVVKEELRATILKVSDIQAGLGAAAYRNQKV